MHKDARVYVAGHRGLVGRAVTNALESAGYTKLIRRARDELDLCDQRAVGDFFASTRPEYVFLCAAKVGGILANDTFPATFISENLSIQTNVITSAYRSGVRKLLFLGSSCIYPKMAPQPIQESALLTGPLEPTNEWYAIAKIAGLKLGQAYRRQYGFNVVSVMPTNLYGPNDNFDLQSSHVLPALIRRFHEAKTAGASEVTLWGTGTPRREFLHVSDLADAVVFVMNHYDEEQIINVGTGEDIRISDLAALVSEVVGYSGAIRYDTTKPDGTSRKLLDVSRLRSLGWRPRVPLKQGIQETYEWFMQHVFVAA
jgi:GDP-L-fucose synthase